MPNWSKTPSRWQQQLRTQDRDSERPGLGALVQGSCHGHPGPGSGLLVGLLVPGHRVRPWARPGPQDSEPLNDPGFQDSEPLGEPGFRATEWQDSEPLSDSESCSVAGFRVSHWQDSESLADFYAEAWARLSITRVG